jgi:flagellar motility protein MotE (MotC chaperone)
MQTIRLNIKDKIYDRLMRLLGKFSKDEVEIIKEDKDFAANRSNLETELNEIVDGKARFVTLEDAEQRLENVIRKHENNL